MAQTIRRGQLRIRVPEPAIRRLQRHLCGHRRAAALRSSPCGRRQMSAFRLVRSSHQTRASSNFHSQSRWSPHIQQQSVPSDAVQDEVLCSPACWSSRPHLSTFSPFRYLSVHSTAVPGNYRVSVVCGIICSPYWPCDLFGSVLSSEGLRVLASKRDYKRVLRSGCSRKCWATARIQVRRWPLGGVTDSRASPGDDDLQNGRLFQSHSRRDD